MQSVLGGPRSLCPPTLGWPGSGGTSFLPLPPPSTRCLRGLHRCRRAMAVRTTGTCSSCSRRPPRPADSACAPCAAGSRAPVCRRHPPRPGEDGPLRGGPGLRAQQGRRPGDQGAPATSPPAHTPGALPCSSRCPRAGSELDHPVPSSLLSYCPCPQKPTKESGAHWGQRGWGPRVTALAWLKTALSPGTSTSP